MEFKKLIEEALRKEGGLAGLVVHEVRESSCTLPGDNYMSVVSLAEVLGTLPDGKAYSGSLFVKRPPGGAERRQIFHVAEAFSNEAVFYQQLFPLCDINLACARCYCACAELLVLQDLRAEGYNMADRRTGFDRHTAAHVLKAIARLHASSYHAMLIKGEEFSKATRQLRPIGLSLPTHVEMMTHSLKRVIEYISQIPELEDLVTPLGTIKDRAAAVLKELRRAKDIRVLSHGDCWINNILIRPEGSDPVRLVDLQACGVLSPAVDVWTFLYTSVKPVVREDIPQLVEEYCHAFLQDLDLLHTPAEQTPSLESFKIDLYSRELYGFLAGAMYAGALTMDSISLPNLDDITASQLTDETFLQQFVSADLLLRYEDLLRFARKRGLFTCELLI